MLARLRAQVLECGIGTRERLAGQLVAELEVEAFKKERIVIQNENRGRMVEGRHLSGSLYSVLRLYASQDTFRKGFAYYSFLSDPVRTQIKL